MIEVLSEIELQLRERFEMLNSGMKSFLHGKKSVAICGIRSILNLVSHDKSVSSTNQVDLFGFILRRENQLKHISLYQKRRFTQLGYTAASIIDAMPYLSMLVNESHLANQHIETVRMFLDCGFFITELFALAYFTLKVSLPLLNFVEISSQSGLLKVFSQLYADLVDGKMDTLREFSVEYRHIQIPNLTSDTESLLLEKMCTQAAKTLLLQCGREYGFGETAKITRSTQLHLLPAEEIKQLPTNNIDSERVFSVFDRKAAVSSRCRNYKFKAKSIRHSHDAAQVNHDNS